MVFAELAWFLSIGDSGDGQFRDIDSVAFTNKLIVLSGIGNFGVVYLDMMASQLGSMLTKLGNLSTSDHASVVSINLFVALLCGCIVIGHLLEENRWVNESITALLIVSL